MTNAMPRRAAVALLGGFFSSALTPAPAQITAPSASPTPEEPHHLFVTDATTPQEIPAHIADAVFIEATINDRKMWFLLDSGSSGLAILRTAADAAQVLKNERGVYTADMTVGSLMARDCHFGRLEGSGIAADGTHVSGIIGAPFFNSNVTTIDWLGKRVTIYPNGSFAAKQFRARPIPIGFTSRLPIVHATFGDKRATMLLDSGSSRTMLFQPFAKDVTLGPQLGDFRGVKFIDRNPVPGQEWLAKPFVIGAYKFAAPLIIIANDPPEWITRLFLDGIIGRDILRAFSVTFDYTNALVYLER